MNIFVYILVYREMGERNGGKERESASVKTKGGREREE